jgi:GGDEF domain-containing protein
MTVLAITLVSIMFMVAIVCLLERSYKVQALKKIISAQKAELISYKNKQEEFAMAMSKTQKDSQNLLINPLTHLLSKEAFDNQFTHLINQSKRLNSLFAVLLLDVNQFARINEKYSHEIGDKLLI